MGGGYLLIVIISTLLGVITQSYIQTTYSRWAQVPVNTGETGAQVARHMLIQEGAPDVDIKAIEGRLTDNYNPTDNALYLSPENRSGGSVASVAVACHEAGHAVQNAIGYKPMQIRAQLVPLTRIASGSWMLAFYAGIMLNMAGIVRASLLLFGVTLLFQLITLPVEFDASARALNFIKGNASLDNTALEGSRKVLFAAALTYVAAALVSSLQLFWLMSQTSNRSRRA